MSTTGGDGSTVIIIKPALLLASSPRGTGADKVPSLFCTTFGNSNERSEFLRVSPRIDLHRPNLFKSVINIAGLAFGFPQFDSV